MKTEEKIKHLEFTQNIINRMAKNSFLLKGWSVTLVLAILATSKYSVKELLPIIVIMFFVLDTYFLYLEKLFRDLYKRIIKDEVEIFSLEVIKSKKLFFTTFFSIINLSFYITLLLLTFN